MQGDRVSPWVSAEHACAAGIRPDEAEQHAERRRLSRSIRPEKPVHSLCGNDEIEPVEGESLAESLHETGGLDGGAFRWCGHSELR